MKTNKAHTYHGITKHDVDGWRIQIRLLGEYRPIPARAPNAEVAARRHDFAMKALETFTEPNLEPNFPADYEGLSVTASAVDAEDKQFRDEIFLLRDDLVAKVESEGGDVNDIELTRYRERQHHLSEKAFTLKVQTHDVITKLGKLLKKSRAIPMSRVQAERIDSLFKTLIAAYEQLPNG